MMLPPRAPFTTYRVYGPYQDKKQNRKIVVLVEAEHRTTMSYARYLLSVKLGKIPPSDVDADHVDGDAANDKPNNIQALDRASNIRKSHPKPTMVTLICPGCGKEFTRMRRQTHLVKGGSPSCCTRKCARAVQFDRPR